MVRWTLEPIGVRAKSAGLAHQACDESHWSVLNQHERHLSQYSESAMCQEIAVAVGITSPGVSDQPNGDRLGYENHKNSIMGIGLKGFLSL